MNAIVIEHVKLSELPEAWRTQIPSGEDVRVTVRIEPEETPPHSQAAQEQAEDPLFGMWRDREDIADVQAYVRKLRAPRY